MTGQDRIRCPNCGANNMPGVAACWQCGMPFSGPSPFQGTPYPVYAARPPRRISCWLALFLALVFMLAGGGLTAYLLLRKSPLVAAPTLEDPVEKSLRDALGGSPTERALRELRQRPTPPTTDGLRGIVPGLTKEAVREKLGEPQHIQRGYLVTEDYRELPRELWHYSYGWVLFRYEQVEGSGRSAPPILRPEPAGSLGGGR